MYKKTPAQTNFIHHKELLLSVQVLGMSRTSESRELSTENSDQ